MVKAAVCREFNAPLVIEDIELSPPGPHDVVVDVKACAICHSDILFAEGAWGGALPSIYGHEAAGVVRETGAKVEGVKPGDHVVVTLIRSCGSCYYCSRGSRVMCEETFDLDRAGPYHSPSGESLFQSMRAGAFAERIVVHESQMAVVDKSIPFAQASLLACGVITGYGAVTNTAQVKPDQTVAIVGCGGVGLNAIQGAAHSGASVVIALDLSAAKREIAKEFGATHAFDPSDPATPDAIKALTHGRGVDFVFVTVGAKRAFDGAFDYITKSAAVVVVGMPASGVYAQYDPGTLAAWNQRILGSKMGEAVVARDIPALAQSYLEGRLKLDELVSNQYPLEKINEAIAEVKTGNVMRNVIVF